ncbi:hypothetical protein ABZX30_19340 [Streptomyces sp. NPDC004542]|uniref:hypothetical protein n=1 Tax=Streptomyces sp. NPDC004542 TaxID=3154281 RepID=UPI0033BA9413
MAGWSTTLCVPVWWRSSPDTATDEGVYRHPVRFLRLRDDLTVQQVPSFGT